MGATSIDRKKNGKQKSHK